MADPAILAALGVTEQEYALAKKVPKVELHLHLDGSLSEAFVVSRLQRMQRDGVQVQSPLSLGFPSLQAWIHAIKGAENDARVHELMLPEMLTIKSGDGNSGELLQCACE
jgi:hypothetical protein